jgi:hypothetical protein
MCERFTHACNSNQLIILARKEGNLPRHAAAGGEVEGDWAKKKGLRGAAASIGFAAPFFFFICFSFKVSGNGLLLGSLLLGFLSNHPHSILHTLRSVFIVQESHRLREVKSQSNSFSFLKFELKLNSKANNYHYLEGKDYLEDKDRIAKAHCSP